MKHGDFTQLASCYDQYRPGYSDSVLTALLSRLHKPIASAVFADIGAGTGKWTRMLANSGCVKVYAVEPNQAMRESGIANSKATNISWSEGSGENTELENQSCDLVSMASSFHWVDFEQGTKEFHRILKPDGLFVALWNPRYIDSSPILMDIEQQLSRLQPSLKRVSSGSSGITATLTEDLERSEFFDDVIYLEGKHKKQLTVEQYIGVWQSVNDIRVQLGEEKFTQFLNYVEEMLRGMDSIEVCYKTRAWSARKIS